MPNETTNRPDRTWLEVAVRLALVLLMILAAFAMLYLMTEPNRTPRETALEAIILTAASIIASFLITKIYAEASYNKSLRDHGVQIASGIMVLKRQIETLTEWVAQKRASVPREGRFELSDSILEHVEQTLLGFRGMTESALGGIAGVIGDALAQYEAIMEQVSTIRLAGVQQVTKIQKEMRSAATQEDFAKFQMQLREIAAQTEKQIAKLARSSALPIPDPPLSRSFTEACPHCSQKNVFQILDRPGETQIIICEFCGNAFNAHVASGHKLLTRKTYAFSFRSRVTELQSRVKQVLVDTDYWVEPVQLEPLVPLAISFDQELKKTPETRSPFNLQLTILENDELLEQSGISKGTVRTFLKIIYRGKVFQFARGQRPTFKATYINDLTPQTILTSFIDASIYKDLQFDENRI